MATTQIGGLLVEYEYLSADVIIQAINYVHERHFIEVERRKRVKYILRGKNETAKAAGIRSYTKACLLDVRFCSITRGHFRQNSLDSIFPMSESPRSPCRCAVLIGCTYFESRSPLRGPSHDVASMYYLLRRCYNWQHDEIVVMTDVPADESKYFYHAIPTKSNILDLASKLSGRSIPGDVLVFYYSGHGGQTGVQNRAVEELLDSKEEYIVACDDMIGDERNIIYDHDLRRVLCEKIVLGAKLRCVFDSCHSGTILDLNVYRTGTSLTSYSPYTYPRGRDILCLTASEDDMLARERPTDQGVFQGVFTRILKAKLRKKRRFAAWDLLHSLNDTLKANGFSQRSTLSSAEDIHGKTKEFDFYAPLIPYQNSDSE